MSVLNRKERVFFYYVYGLGICSTVPLPDLVPEEAGCDVFVHVKNNDRKSASAYGGQWHFEVSEEKALLYFKNVGVFHVRRGREITVIPSPNAELRTIQSYIVGTVMAVLLYQRDLLVLHASAVETDGDAVAFLGGSGYGKSSIAAALHSRGLGIVADDVMPVHFNTGLVTVFPGFPQLKLSPEVAAFLGYDIDSLLLLQHTDGKLGCRVTQGFSQIPLPLKHIYVLAGGSIPEIEPLRPQEAFLELVRHSYPTRMLQQGGASHFLKCTSLAGKVPISRLRNPYSLSSLPQLAQLVQENIAA